ncbi:hypothetical protein VTN31DRAFT_3737 [Thermomyces dupontii]|uniref:uncharacterized protein n=1 Tax=Talaromyces thermophilus TaxID=28565 RepID=UPI0037429A6D
MAPRHLLAIRRPRAPARQSTRAPAQAHLGSKTQGGRSRCGRASCSLCAAAIRAKSLLLSSPGANDATAHRSITDFLFSWLSIFVFSSVSIFLDTLVILYILIITWQGLLHGVGGWVRLLLFSVHRLDFLSGGRFSREALNWVVVCEYLRIPLVQRWVR